LYLLFTRSLSEGVVPTQWKFANVTPIYKKGTKSDPSNYRPVSLTSVISKLMERLIAEDILVHLRSNNLLCAQQHGFTPGKSTSTNLLEALDVWTEALSHGLPVDIIYMDYAKAFDTVPHERLLRQIQSLGINDQALLWVRSFLTSRHQRVIVNGALSETSEVTSGVPQGSVLGPVLFTMFVCDIPSQINNMVAMFADDTKLYSAIQDPPDEYTRDLQSDIDRLQAWASRMQMLFHPDKCVTMHLGRNIPHHEYTMQKQDGTPYTLKTVDKEKDLGVLIDHKLTFSQHIQAQVNKASRTLGALKHTYSAISKESFLLLYKSLVRPHLEYASVVWSPSLKRDKDAIERVQRRATRMVQGLSHLSYPERLTELKLPTLEYRRQRADILATFKILKGLDHVNHTKECQVCGNSMFKPAVYSSTRGHTHSSCSINISWASERHS